MATAAPTAPTIPDAEGIKEAHSGIHNLLAAAISAPHVAAFSDAADDAAAEAHAAFYAPEIMDGHAAIDALFAAAAAFGYAAGYAAAGKGYDAGYDDGYGVGIAMAEDGVDDEDDEDDEDEDEGEDDVVMPVGKRNDGFLDERQKQIANGAL